MSVVRTTFVLGCFASVCLAGAARVSSIAAPRPALRPSKGTVAPTSLVRKDSGGTQTQQILNATATTVSKKTGGPCICELSNPAWVQCTRTTPKCIFIDLGAANGNSFQTFISNGYGPVSGCPSGQWEADLVEANPRFNTSLELVANQHTGLPGPGTVRTWAATAAYMCEAYTTFYLDTENHDKNYWGSSLSTSHPDTQKSGHVKVTVPTVNLNRMLYELTIPGDWVMVKMDIEGSEWDVLPCLSKAPSASLIDRLYMEQHSASWGLVGTTQQDMDLAKSVLRQRGVDIPHYNSDTF